MDASEADILLDKLIGWGLVEERDDHHIGPTRRWNARVQAAAERLNLEVARTGVQPEGNPLVLAVSLALREEAAPLEPREFDDAIRMLVTLELTRMSPDKRARYGFDLPL